MEMIATIGRGLLISPLPSHHHGHQSPSSSSSSPAPSICLRRRHHDAASAAGAAVRKSSPVLSRHYQHKSALASTTASRSEGSPKSSQSLIESCYTAYDSLKQGIAASAIPDDDKKRMKARPHLQAFNIAPFDYAHLKTPQQQITLAMTTRSKSSMMPTDVLLNTHTAEPEQHARPKGVDIRRDIVPRSGDAQGSSVPLLGYVLRSWQWIRTYGSTGEIICDL